MITRILHAGAFVAAGVFAAWSLGSGDSNQHPSGQALSPAGPVRTARAAHTATRLADGTVLVTGGFAREREQDPFAEAELFDRSTNAFRSAGSMTTGRQSHTASLLPDGRVLITGGCGRNAMSTSEIYDAGSGRFESASSLRTGRAAHEATELPDGRILISGGQNMSGDVLSSVEIYDPTTATFSPAGSMTTPRVSHSQTLLEDGTVLIVGGTSGWRSLTRILATAEVFDPQTGESAVVASMTTPRYKHAVVPLRDGRVLVIAGSDDQDWNGKYDSAEIFDPKTRTLSATPKLNSPRFKLSTAAARLDDGRVLVAGGSAVIEIFDPATDRFIVVPERLDAGRFFSTATGLNDGRALITGGYDRSIHSTSKAWVFAP